MFNKKVISNRLFLISGLAIIFSIIFSVAEYKDLAITLAVISLAVTAISFILLYSYRKVHPDDEK